VRSEAGLDLDSTFDARCGSIVSSHRHFRSITGLDLLNVSSYYRLVVKGVIIVAAVWLGKRGEK